MQPALKNIKLEKPKLKISHHVEKIKIVKNWKIKNPDSTEILHKSLGTLKMEKETHGSFLVRKKETQVYR